MNSYSRHLLIEALKVFVVTLSLMLIVLTLAGGIKEAVREGLPFFVVLKIVPFVALEMLRFTVPASMLFAICSVVGRASASNEFIALTASGIHPLRPIVGLIVFAYMLSITTYWVYDACANWSRPGLHRTLIHAIDDIAYSTLTVNSSFRSNEFSIVVEEVENGVLRKPKIDVFGVDGRPTTMLTADDAELRHVDGELMLICRNAFVDVSGVGRFHFPGEYSQPIPLRSNLAANEDTASPAELPGHAIFRQTLRESQRLHEVNARLDSAVESMSSTQPLHAERDARKLRLNRLQAEDQRRMSNGFACLSFALLGIPVAAWLRTADNMSTFFISFLPVLLIYYPLLMAGETLIRGGVMVPFAVWIADITLAVAGIIMIRRVMLK